MSIKTEIEFAANWINTQHDKDMLWSFFKEGPPKDTGYTFWENPILERVSRAIDCRGHSGCSFGATMRGLQELAKRRCVDCKIHHVIHGGGEHGEGEGCGGCKCGDKPVPMAAPAVVYEGDSRNVVLIDDASQMSHEDIKEMLKEEHKYVNPKLFDKNGTVLNDNDMPPINEGSEIFAIEHHEHHEQELKESLFGSGAQKNMDKYNSEAAKVMIEKGQEVFIKHVFTNQDTGKPMSYCEMRSRYG